MQAADWPKLLRRASFKGAPFETDDDGITYGKRAKVHEFPHRDRPYVEEFGEKAIEFSVSAYVASDDALAEMDALVAACRSPGPGTLILPTDGAVQALCYKCERKHKSDRMGYVQFSLSFHEAGAGFGTFSAGLLRHLAATAAGLLFEVKGSLFGALFGGIRSLIGDAYWLARQAIRQVEDWAQEIEDVRLSIVADVEALRDIESDVKRLFREADRLVGGGAREFVPLVADCLAGIRLAVAPDVAVTIMADIAARAPLIALMPSAARTPSAGDPLLTSEAEERIAFEIDAVVRRCALVQMALAAVEAEYPNRDAAIRVRAEIADALGIEAAAAGGMIGRRLDEVRERAIAAISARLLDLKPAIVVEAATTAPSLVWSWRLYGDLDGESDLITRNHVRHPALMPARIEAEIP